MTYGKFKKNNREIGKSKRAFTCYDISSIWEEVKHNLLKK